MMIDFLRKTIKLKRLKRGGWRKIGVKEIESVADHTFSVALAAMIFADKKKLDTKKAIQMSLIHDLGELVVGDQPPGKQDRVAEQKGLELVLSHLPKDLRNEYLNLWLEFEAQETEEAKLVKQLDKIEMGLQALEYENIGYSPELLNQFWINIEKKITDKELKELFNLMKKTRKIKR